jgi:hypothetical protein
MKGFEKLLKRLKLNYIQFFIYLAILIFAMVKISSYYSDKSVVLKDFMITEGKIIEYKVFGVGPNRYLTYEYIVDDRVYTREINGPNKRYDECSENHSLCENKKFIVIYSKNAPDKSLIDVTREIQEIRNPELPKTMRNFQ